MERQRYMVRLSAEERQELESIVKKGKGDAPDGVTTPSEAMPDGD